MRAVLFDTASVNEAVKAPGQTISRSKTIIKKTNKNLVFHVLYIVQFGYTASNGNPPSFAPFMMETLLFGTKKGDSSNTSRTYGIDLSPFNYNDLLDM